MLRINMLAAAVTYEAVLVSEAPHLQMSHNFATLTSANTRANSAPQWHRYKSSQESFAFSLPNSRAPVTQSQTHARLPVLPPTDGTSRYPDTVQFHHIMEHYIQLYNAEKARNTIDLAAVVPVAAPVLATAQPADSDTSDLAIRPSAPSPSVTQGLSGAPLPLPTVSESSTITSRTTLPDFIVGGYKVKSDKTGDPKDDEVFKSYKYISSMARTLATKVPIFVENTSGHGQSYEDWRLIFANAVGNEYYVDDFVMGEWLRGLLHQEIANDVDMFMGVDAFGTSMYRFCSAKVLDTYSLGSIYASQLTDHHFNTEMQRVCS